MLQNQPSNITDFLAQPVKRLVLILGGLEAVEQVQQP